MLVEQYQAILSELRTLSTGWRVSSYSQVQDLLDQLDTILDKARREESVEWFKAQSEKNKAEVAEFLNRPIPIPAEPPSVYARPLTHPLSDEELYDLQHRLLYGGSD